jgi:hypothetical protein
MKKFFIFIGLSSLLVINTHTMLNTHKEPQRGVLPLETIITNTLAKDKIYSYLSRPKPTDFDKTAADLTRIPEDLFAQVSSAQKKEIPLSLESENSDNQISHIIECFDNPNQMIAIMASGKITTIDQIDNTVHLHKKRFGAFYSPESENKIDLYPEQVVTQSAIINHVHSDNPVPSTSFGNLYPEHRATNRQLFSYENTASTPYPMHNTGSIQNNTSKQDSGVASGYATHYPPHVSGYNQHTPIYNQYTPVPHTNNNLYVAQPISITQTSLQKYYEDTRTMRNSDDEDLHTFTSMYNKAVTLLGDEDFSFSNESDDESSHDSDNTEIDLDESHKTVVSRDGRVWGRYAAHVIVKGKISDLSNAESSESLSQIHIKKNSDYDKISDIAINDDGTQTAAIWNTMQTLCSGNDTLVFSHENKLIQTFEMPKIDKMVFAHHAPCIAVSHQFGSVSDSFNVSIWGTQDGKLQTKVRAFKIEQLITGMDFSYDDTMLYFGSVMGNLAVFKRHFGISERHAAHSGAIRIVRSHPYDLCVATASDDGTVKLWSRDIQIELAHLEYAAKSLTFSQDGTFLYILTQDNTLHRIPLLKPLETVCFRALLLCKNSQERQSFKNWDLFKKVLSEKQESKGILSEQWYNYLNATLNS